MGDGWDHELAYRQVCCHADDGGQMNRAGIAKWISVLFALMACAGVGYAHRFLWQIVGSLKLHLSDYYVTEGMATSAKLLAILGIAVLSYVLYFRRSLDATSLAVTLTSAEVSGVARLMLSLIHITEPPRP